MRIVKAGMLTTVEDMGRYGYAHLGISPAGAADALSFRLANRLVGNDENAAALEMTMIGSVIEFERDAVVALAGAACGHVAMNVAFEMATGTVLDCTSIRNGARSYLAVQGGLEVAAVLGSASTFLAGRFGGLEGRAVKKGDVLEIASVEAALARRIREDAPILSRRRGAVRVTAGLQWHWFGEETQKKFLAATYTVSPQSNRAGLRLSGDAITQREPSQLLTEGVSVGAIQIPPDGQPIILFVDQQTTGGYPKVANVISTDLHRIGQLRPGDTIRFELVSMDSALELLREQEEQVREAFAP